MKSLQQTCNEIIEASEKATYGPWQLNTSIDCRRGTVHQSEGHSTICGYEPDAGWAKTASGNKPNFEYIVLAANQAPKLAKALLVMEEALLLISETTTNKGFATGVDQSIAKEALAEAEKLLGGGE